MKDPKIGFIILSHNYSEQRPQLYRLVQRLSQFPDTRIVIHHDFSQSPLPKNTFSEFPVQFVQPHVKTTWGGMGIVYATFEAIKLLNLADPFLDWFVLLSANDYPIKPVNEILDFFRKSKVDAYLDSAEYEKAPHAEFIHKAVFTEKKFSYPFMSRKGKFYFRQFRRPVPNSRLPFNENFRLYNGEQWFMGNKKTLKFLAEIDYKNHPLVKYINTTEMAPDNVIYQTFIGNNPDIKSEEKGYRFIDWRNCQNYHPNTLTEQHFEELINSDAFFARKLDYTISEKLLNRIDSELLEKNLTESIVSPNKDILEVSI
jgi:hypothetical protein